MESVPSEICDLRAGTIVAVTNLSKRGKKALEIGIIHKEDASSLQASVNNSVGT